MVKVLITNTYHNTSEVVFASSLDKARSAHVEGLEVTAENLTPNEIEEDWEQYYDTYEQAYDETYKSILNQLKREVNCKVIK